MKEGWVKKKLGEVCEINMGQSPDSKFYNSNNEGYPFYQGKKDFGKTKLNLPRVWTTVPTKISKINDILMSVRAPVGSINYNLIGDICIGRGLASITVHEILHKDYLFYYLLSMQNQIEGKEGVGFSSINKKGISDIEINIPSHKEQCLIVEKLDAGFAKIEQIKANAKKNLRQAKDLFQAMLRECITEKEGWTKHKLSEIYDVRDGTHDSPKYQENGYPLVTSKNLKDGALDLTKVKFISREDFEAINKRSKVDVGDVLFAMIGTIGNPVQVMAPANYAIKNMALFKVPKNQSSRYLYYLLSSKMVLEKMSKGSKGTTQKFVSLGYLRQFIIPLPNSLAEQHKIVDKLDKLSDICKKLEDNYNRILTECDALKQALLRKAFNGEL